MCECVFSIQWCLNFYINNDIQFQLRKVICSFIYTDLHVLHVCSMSPIKKIPNDSHFKLHAFFVWYNRWRLCWAMCYIQYPILNVVNSNKYQTEYICMHFHDARHSIFFIFFPIQHCTWYHLQLIIDDYEHFIVCYCTAISMVLWNNNNEWINRCYVQIVN